jgi:hypothetical protein
MSVGSLNIITDGLVFYVDAGNDKSYPGSGINCYDITSNNNSGVLTNGPTFDPSNVGSIVFDGVNDYIIFPDSPSLSIIGDMTINCWIKVSDFNNYRGIVSKVNVNISNPFDYYILQSTGEPSLLRGDGINNSPTHWDSFTGNNPPQLNIWQNISVTYQGGTVTHYLNSIQNGSGTINPIITDNGGDMYIGNRSDNATPMLGNISCLQLYNRALTPQEILHNYNKLKFRFL